MSQLEEVLAFQLRALKIPYEREVKLIEGRRFRFDFVFRAQKLAVEVNGGEWVQGRHSRSGGMRSDAEKIALASALGWRVIPVAGSMVESGEAVALIQQSLSVGEEPTS